MTELAKKARQKEWESYVSRFQNTDSDATAGSKWTLMERIYEMDQKTEFRAILGQLKKFHR
jgi:L-rhamnose mutarotase